MVDDRSCAPGETPGAGRGRKRHPNGAPAGSRVRGFLCREDGSVTAFSLFILVMMFMVAGMAVDLIRFETRRAALQNTLDSGTLAAASLRSDTDAEALVRSFMEVRGYDSTQTDVTVAETRIAGAGEGATGKVVARSVTASHGFGMNTIFMPFLGIDELGTTSAGAAQEGIQTLEISLVLDISGSMRGRKIADLRTAARNFVAQVIDPLRDDLPVTISIVPFNQTVVAPDSLLERLNTHSIIPIHPGDQATYQFSFPLTEYDRTAPGSKCVRFMDDQLITSDLEEHLDAVHDPNYLLIRAITPTEELEMMAYYDPEKKSYGPGGRYDRPGDDFNRRCDPTQSPILPYATDATELTSFIDALEAGGNTANDNGLKWGVALLDPAFRPIVTDMIDDGLLPSQIDGRPFDYKPENFLKVIVLMTDGKNTTQFDLDPDKKAGPSRVWFSQTAADETGDWHDGFFVEMPDNRPNKRWLRVHDLGDDNDGELYGMGTVASQYKDLTQWSFTRLYDRFSEYAVRDLFYDADVGLVSDLTDYGAAERAVQDGPDADRRMSGNPTDSPDEFGICDAAKVNNDILIFTIAFNAGNHAETVMRDCATSAGHYFSAQDGAALNQAFDAIATSITSLRLTQ